MDEANNPQLQDALRHKNDLEAAFDELVEKASPGIHKHMAEAERSGIPQNLPPEQLEDVAGLLNGKGHVEDAAAQVAEARGFPGTAAYHEEQRDLFWKRRDEVRARL